MDGLIATLLFAAGIALLAMLFQGRTVNYECSHFGKTELNGVWYECKPLPEIKG
jgi:hypothetical protein